MADFNWGQAGDAPSGGGYPVQRWWDTAGDGSNVSVSTLSQPGGTLQLPSPGQFEVDVTSPQAMIESLRQSGVQQAAYVDAIGKALFAEKGSLLGGIPLIGDVGRTLSGAASGFFGSGV